MSFIRLLALSYLAWAAVFVMAVILVAHLPLPGNMPPATGTPAHKTSQIAAQLPPGKAGPRVVARLDLAPVAPFPSPPVNSDLSLPEPPVAQEPQPRPNPPEPSPPITVAARPVQPPPPATKPEPRPVAKLELAPPAPVPVPRPHGDTSPLTPHVVKEPEHKVATSAPPKADRIAALPDLHLPSAPPQPSPSSGNTQHGAADFRIPDPPSSSLANLPVHFLPASHGNRKRASVKPAFRIPDPPPLDAPIFSHSRLVAPRHESGVF